MNILIEKLEENKFITKQKTEQNKTISAVVLDFNPVLSQLTPNQQNSFCIIHNRARPVNNKALWKWGVLYQGEYHLVSHYESEPVPSCSLERLDLENPENPPTWVVCYWNAKVEFKNDMAFITGITT